MRSPSVTDNALDVVASVPKNFLRDFLKSDAALEVA